MTTPCLYSIVRYAPYAETEEFANIGVVICAPKENYFDFQITKRNDSRVKSFFHDDCIFPVAKTPFKESCNSQKHRLHRFLGISNLLNSLDILRRKKNQSFSSARQGLFSAQTQRTIQHAFTINMLITPITPKNVVRMCLPESSSEALIELRV